MSTSYAHKKGCMAREIELDSAIIEADIIYEAEWHEGDETTHYAGGTSIDVYDIRFHSIYWEIGGIPCELHRKDVHLRLVDVLDELLTLSIDDDALVADCIQHASDCEDACYNGLEHHSRKQYEEWLREQRTC